MTAAMLEKANHRQRAPGSLPQHIGQPMPSRTIDQEMGAIMTMTDVASEWDKVV